VFDSGLAALVDFDTRSDDDRVFGSGTGCRGRVHLLLLPQARGAPLAQSLRLATQQGMPLQLRLVLDGLAIGSGDATIAASSTMQQREWRWDAGGAGWTATSNDAGLGSPTGGLDSAGDGLGNAVDEFGSPADGRGSPGQCPGVSTGCAELLIAPPPRVLLLGAGPETPPLLDFMRHFGWFATVVEHRGRWSAFARADLADRLMAQPPSAAAAALIGEPADAAIAMSHNYTIDAQYLRFCAQRDIGYVGLLGPPARRDALLAELGDAADALRPRLHAPVGLDLGGSGPEAIALAIVAELQRFFANKPRG
jgi:xanthine dehydrogenase accessory factor